MKLDVSFYFEVFPTPPYSPCLSPRHFPDLFIEMIFPTAVTYYVIQRTDNGQQSKKISKHFLVNNFVKCKKILSRKIYSKKILPKKAVFKLLVSIFSKGKQQQYCWVVVVANVVSIAGRLISYWWRWPSLTSASPWLSTPCWPSQASEPLSTHFLDMRVGFVYFKVTVFYLP